MKMKSLFTLLFLFALQGMVFAQFFPIGTSGKIVNNNPNGVLIQSSRLITSNPPLFGQLDVRGDNMILADPRTTNFPTRFIGFGVAGGGSPNACPGYGIRIQPNTANQLSLFLQSDREPTLQFGPGPFSFVYKPDPLDKGCGTRIITISNRSRNLVTVSGAISATAFNVSSDRRLKRDFEDISSPLEKILATNGQRYYYTDKTMEFPFNNMPQTEQLGYIAQELQEILPQAVNQDDSGYLSVKYHMLVPVITEAMKEQQDIIDQQQVTIDEQQTTIDQQKARMAQLEDRLVRIEQVLNQQGQLELGKDNIQLRQNRPNPFGKNTTIDYKLPEGFNAASIRIIDASGKEIRNYAINNTVGQLDVDGTDLTSGIYYYSLIVNGQVVRTEKMIVR
ncbi:MAG: tail fiber domain-containing protein [Bacteroidota bacterium]